MVKDIGIYSVNNEEKIRLNSNENPRGYTVEEIKNMINSLDNIELNRYPNSDGDNLRKAYGKIMNLEKDNLIIGNGSDEMINLIISKYISKGEKVLTFTKDFVMYDFYTDLNEGKVVKYKIDLDKGIDIEDFINFGKRENVKLIIFSNPNNPTGYGFEINDIKRVLEEFKDKIVLVDEAYYEFYGETMIPFINEYKNLLITRTLSKAFGLAALRVGFLISNKENIEELEKYKTPYNVNTISQEIAIKVLEDVERFKRNLNLIIEEREILFEKLLNTQEKAKKYGINIKFYNSKANFIYGESDYKEKLVAELNNKDILIRSFSDNSFRITVGTKSENKKVIEALESFIEGGI